MIDSCLKSAQVQMEKSVSSMLQNLAKVRTGRAHPSLIESVSVDVYGSVMPLSQVASIVAGDAQTLVVTVWDKTQISAVEKAILRANLGLNPVVQGEVMRIPLPPLTQERRESFVKVVRSDAESGRVSVRNARREALGELKQAKADKAITEDDEHQAQVKIQQLTDQFIQKIDACLSEKEVDLRSMSS